MVHSYKNGTEKRLHHFGTTAPHHVGASNKSTRKIISAPFLKTALFSTQMAQSSKLAQSFFCAIFIRMRHFRSKWRILIKWRNPTRLHPHTIFSLLTFLLLHHDTPTCKKLMTHCSQSLAFISTMFSIWEHVYSYYLITV
jgi:hypothetical protein